jgi:diguanylate cyclase (GGDEF)-like protein
LYGATRADKRALKPKYAPLALTSAGPDLAARLRTLQRTLRSRVAHRSALLDMMRAVNSTLDPAKLAELVLDRAMNWVPVPCWALVSSGASGGELTVLGDHVLTEDVGPAVNAIATWVMHHGSEFLTSDLRFDRRLPGQSGGAVLGFPLISRGTCVGALIAIDHRPSSRQPKLSPGVLRTLRELLEPAAAALDAAVQLKRVEELSVTDDLTRLYNSRYLNQVLRRETKRATRGGRPLSLLFLDLDGFKSINDAHGHLCGSRALVEAAGVVRDSARETDVVARFGGDEFALILPDTGREGAIAVGERVRQRIAAHGFLAADGLEIHLTASVGVATLPDVATTPDELMQAADMAMYRVKQSGKNGIQAATTPTDN